MKVKELKADIDFVGAFDNCYIGCDSCDFITNTHTFYKDGKATGLSLKVECQNVEQCRHLMEHLQFITAPRMYNTGEGTCDKL